MVLQNIMIYNINIFSRKGYYNFMNNKINSYAKIQILKEEYPINLLIALKGRPDITQEINEDVINNITLAISDLNDRERQIIFLRYVERKTLKEISHIFGISSERTRQIESKSLWKLRKIIGISY